MIVFEARNPNPLPDPVIYLAGGGGVNQLAMMSLYSDLVSAVIEERDFIMYNQRGAPLTEPALECAGIEDLFWELAEQHPPIEGTCSSPNFVRSAVPIWSHAVST